MTSFSGSDGDDIDVIQEILDKSVELLFKIREAGKLQADICMADVMNDLDKHNQEIQQLIAKINPELHKIITDPKNKDKSSFELIKHYCKKTIIARPMVFTIILTRVIFIANITLCLRRSRTFCLCKIAR